MKIVTWNVNSINMRYDQLIELIDHHQPDAILLQELKCQEEQFPKILLENLGYKIFINGQKAYNGVAILIKNIYNSELITNCFHSSFDEESRYIEVLINNKITLACVYVIQGQDPESERFIRKISFLEELRKYLISKKTLIIIGGDFNVAPYDIDINDANNCRNSIGFHSVEKAQIRKFYNDGFYDPLRLINQNEVFSWWHYMGGSWQKNNGMRIDYFLINSKLTKFVKNAYHDKSFRSKQKPSDHIPVFMELDLEWN